MTPEDPPQRDIGLPAFLGLSLVWLILKGLLILIPAAAVVGLLRLAWRSVSG
ncbi:hypothetical protein Q0812_01545 [Brevundimonas sp. 2R-24]|uniref:Uncharacterized protein n=1 Tax=Peiella sedimenti TaxID=3061083 RepID=A0ABT8SLH3_9CAUL|nr:hypothetical protein [Caulobacteraceae bacterium XZ-24]